MEIRDDAGRFRAIVIDPSQGFGRGPNGRNDVVRDPRVNHAYLGGDRSCWSGMENHNRPTRLSDIRVLVEVAKGEMSASTASQKEAGKVDNLLKFDRGGAEASRPAPSARRRRASTAIGARFITSRSGFAYVA